LKTYVYVDGFNLYYGAVKDTPYRWLDLNKLSQLLLPRHEIAKIKYFTARIVPRPHDPEQQSRQETYLRALLTLPNLEIIYGMFLAHPRRAMLADSAPGAPQYVWVVRTEEKGSDVNLATHLVSDGYKGNYEVAVIVSNDSDLVEAVRVVRDDLRMPIGVLNPHRKSKPSYHLLKHASFFKVIREGALAASQFPATLEDARGTFRKPEVW
jgi:uncharacterized LabA/DUF88 family protein